MCSCELCKFSRKIKRTINSGSHPKKNRLIMEMAERICNVECDLDYERCVANGSWPTAVEVLEQRLVVAKQADADRRAQEGRDAND